MQSLHTSGRVIVSSSVLYPLIPSEGHKANKTTASRNANYGIDEEMTMYLYGSFIIGYT